MKVEGKIYIDSQLETVSIFLETGNYALNHLPQWVSTWLEIEMENIKELEQAEQQLID